MAGNINLIEKRGVGLKKLRRYSPLKVIIMCYLGCYNIQVSINIFMRLLQL